MEAEFENIEHAAEAWLVRSDGGLSAKEASELRRWLSADPRHAAAFDQARRSWNQFDALRGSSQASELESELDNLAPRRATISRWIPLAVAAAAALAIAYVGWWRPLNAKQNFETMAATEVGVLRILQLPDGSTVQLNTGTAISVRFSKAERAVSLDHGEALFTVAKDPQRPFIVSTAGIHVRAVGTAFNVRSNGERIGVIVTEGAVQVNGMDRQVSLLAQPADSPASSAPILQKSVAKQPVLSAGHRVEIAVPPNHTGPLAPVIMTALSTAEMDRVLAWQHHELIFTSAPLAEIVAEFNRYNRQKLVIADPDLARRSFGGTFRADNLSTFVLLLKSNFGVVAEERKGEIILRTSSGG